MMQGRNQPCSCGSGKKYKRCCLKQHLMDGQNTKAILEAHSKDSSPLQVSNVPFAGSVGPMNPVAPLKQKPGSGMVRYSKNEVDNEEEMHSLFINMLHNLHEWKLKKLPHVKEYRKLRKLHSEIMTSMANCLDEGKFELKVDVEAGIAASEAYRKQKNIHEPMTVRITKISYDFDTYEGEQAYYDFHIYKAAPNINSITEEFIRSRRYRKPEKIALLEGMHNSVRGLFEVVKVDVDQGYVYLKEVFTGEVFRIIDIGMSIHEDSINLYFYRRIITVGEISMGAGVTLIFGKKDKFIKNFIIREKANYHPFGEMARFNELYTRYTTSPDRVKTVRRELK